MAIQLEPDRRLILSFREVQEMTSWPEAMVVDYQGILQDLLDVASQVDEGEETLQEQITENAGNIAKNEQWLDSVAISTGKALIVSAAAAAKQRNLEQLIYAW